MSLTILWTLSVLRLKFDAVVEHGALTHLSNVWPKESLLRHFSSETGILSLYGVNVIRESYCQIVSKIFEKFYTA